MIKQMRIAIVGQGYVGLTITQGALSAGHQVIGIDRSAAVISNLKSGKSHIEGISDSVIVNGVSSGAFKVSDTYLRQML
jgi:UDP-N-acetyl-D-glucosamine dehydrogenase